MHFKTDMKNSGKEWDHAFTMDHFLRGESKMAEIYFDFRINLEGIETEEELASWINSSKLILQKTAQEMEDKSTDRTLKASVKLRGAKR